METLLKISFQNFLINKNAEIGKSLVKNLHLTYIENGNLNVRLYPKFYLL